MKASIQINELRRMMADALKLRNVDSTVAQFMIDDFIEAELSGQASHGLSKFLLLDATLKNIEGEVVVEKEIGNYAKINGKKNLGHYAGVLCIDKVLALAEQYGNGIVALNNASRYSRVKPFARRIAENGYIGIVMNNGGPAAVAPYGGTTPIFGTNPICFAFPSKNSQPYVFDFSTSKKVWAEIRQAILEKRELPDDSFYDTDGNITKDPHKADAVMAFGEAKGYALCYAVEILTGAFVGSRMGQQVNDEYDLGFLFIALSPDMFSDKDSFMYEIDNLADEVRASRSISSGGNVYVPGERTAQILKKNKTMSSIQVDDEILDRVRAMSISLEGGLESNNKLN